MDTDDLSEETYQAVIIKSEKFNHNLSLQFGVLASICSDDNDYLNKANQLILEWKLELSNSIGEIFFDTVKPTVWVFENILTITSVINSGDISGIMCTVKEDNSSVIACSLTHLIFDSKFHLYKDISEFQRKRHKK